MQNELCSGNRSTGPEQGLAEDIAADRWDCKPGAPSEFRQVTARPRCSWHGVWLTGAGFRYW